ncbi:40049_t:CDS:2, partial [Gigaspora margarita]
MTMDLCETSNIEWNDPDNTYDCLNSDFSLATDSVSETSLVLNDNNSHKFFFNYEALQKTRKSIYNIDDDVTMNNIKDDSSFISSKRNSTDFNALEEDYEIDDIPCENLVPCVDEEIQCCPNYEKSRYRLRSLRQLIGTWEIDESVIGPSIFTNQMFLKFENIFYNLSACNEKEVGVDKVYEELVKLIEPGCQ